MAAPMRIFRNINFLKTRLFYSKAALSGSLHQSISIVCNSKRVNILSSLTYSTGSGKASSGAEKDPERLFIRNDVQQILKRITGFDIEKIFRARPMQDLQPPEYKLLTDEELTKIKAEAEERARSYLQMSPVMNAWKPPSENSIILRDKTIANFEEGDSKYVFTDISNDVPYRRRAVVVREVDGTLRAADAKERDRTLHVYFPRDGKSHNVPRMFEDELLEKVLAEHRYEYILDAACNQFEPDDPEYIRVVQRTYEHIASRNKFDDLRSTRHFGPMAFYLTLHRKIDGLLVDMLHRDLLMDGSDLVQLCCILHPDCATASVAKKANNGDPSQLIKVFAKNDAKEGGIIELALQSYDTRHSTRISATATL